MYIETCQLEHLSIMEITVTSRETIKPSSSTPRHLKHVKLSLIDQFMPATFYARLILFYSAQGEVHRFHNTNLSERFKKSLSEVLTDFYPLAGKFNSADYSIECNDAGLEYIEARVKAPLTLSQLLACPNPEELDQLHPYDAYNYGTGFTGLSAVQVTVFEECGSMAIGFSLSHLLTDAASLMVFINTWAAAVARGDEDKAETKTLAAVFNAASLFPPRDMPEQKYEPNTESAKRFTVKRFVFSPSKIDMLKAKFMYQRPTRVEVVSALLIKCMIKACKSRCSTPVFSGIGVNIRSRMNLPQYSFGNLVLSLATKLVSPSDTLNDIGIELRGLIKEMDSDYVGKLQADNGLLLFEYIEQLAKVEGRVVGVTSWCRFPVYEADVGWGAPIWVASVHPTWENCVVLVDTKDGGIEAWATMDKEDMAIFESDNELLEFACANPLVSVF